jgi:NADH dehydrogenase
MTERVLVTGATGFIGRSVVRRLLASGRIVRAYVRDGTRGALPAHARLELARGSMTDERALTAACRDADWIVHLAAAKSDEPDSEDVNVGGARRLVAAVRAGSARLVVNVSTQSAKLPRPGTYGRTKAAADRVLHEAGIAVVTLRSSLVYGEVQEGVFGSLVRWSALPVIPVFGDGRARFWPIHRDDLAELILRSAASASTHGRVLDAGGPDGCTFDELVRRVCAARGRRRPLVHLPVWVGRAAARALRVLPRPPISESNVLGGAVDVPLDVGPICAATGFVPRALDQGLAEAFPRLSPVEEEARALLRYASSGSGRAWEPTRAERERYRAALAAHGLEPRTSLAPSVLRRPLLLGALDALVRVRHHHSPLAQKLLVAAAIVECTPRSASWLLPRERSLLVLGWATLRLGARVLCKGLGALPLLLVPGFVRRNAGV